MVNTSTAYTHGVSDDAINTILVPLQYATENAICELLYEFLHSYFTSASWIKCYSDQQRYVTVLSS